MLRDLTLRTTPEVLRAFAAAEPDRVAVIVDGIGAITVAEVEQNSNALARGLVARGVSRGDRIGLRFNNAQWIDSNLAYFGIQKAGGIVVALPKDQPDLVINHMLEHANCHGVICSSDLNPPGFAGWTATVSDLTDGQEQGAFWISVQPHDPAEIIYTSGTTGMPKGIVRVHDTVTYYNRWKSPKGSPERFPDKIVLTHRLQGASIYNVRIPFRVSGPTTAVVMPFFDPERFCALVQGLGECDVSLLPVFALTVLDSGAYERHKPMAIRQIQFEGDRLPPIILRRFREIFPETSLVNLYGSTESGPAHTTVVHSPGSDSAAHYAAVGHLGENALDQTTEVKIVDKKGRELPRGEPGEVLLRRSNALRNWYDKDPEATRQVFLPDGWTRMDDIGYIDEQGYLFLLDRRRDIISRGAWSVSPIEIEAVLHEHEAVAEVSVFAITHDMLGEEVAVAVVLRRPTSAQELQRFARERLEPYKVPRRFIFVDELPRNARGKVIKRLLREQVGHL